MLTDRVLADLQIRRQKILDGKVNCIPFPFKRFRNEFVGLEHGSYILVSSFSKGGKSQFTSYTFIYESLLYAYTHKNLKVKFLYFALEESPERVMQRFMSFYIYKYTKFSTRISPRDLRSTDERKPVPEEVLNLMEEEEFQNILKFFEENVIFCKEKNPTGIYKFCKNFAEERGTVYKKTVKYKDEFGITRETEGFDHYVANDEDEYIIPIIDTINNIDVERGMEKRAAINKLSEYLAVELRNEYNMSPIVIQQQNVATEGNDAVKLGRTRPGMHGLYESTQTSKDCNYMLGLYSPEKFGIQEYFGYDISKLKNNIRFLEVVVGRDGETGGIIALYFDGATCTFMEMPKPDDKEGMEKVYKFIEERDKNELL